MISPVSHQWPSRKENPYVGEVKNWFLGISDRQNVFYCKHIGQRKNTEGQRKYL